MQGRDYSFFIFDETAMQQNDSDDMADAVVHYHPKHTRFISNNRINKNKNEDNNEEIDAMLFFGHIVGTVKCMETLANCLPAVIALERCKFSVLRHSHYLLFLGYESTVDRFIPDGFVQKELQDFVDLFAFYHGNVDRLLAICLTHGRDFERTISHFFSYIHQKSPIQTIFNPLESVSFSAASASIASRAAQILEFCQRRETVYCGALLYEHKIVSSQIPPTLLHHLLLLRDDNHLDRRVRFHKLGFDCPIGVHIVCVYVTREQYDEITAISTRCPYAKVVATENSGLHVQSSTAENSTVRLSKTISSTSIASVKEELHETRSLNAVADSSSPDTRLSPYDSDVTDHTVVLHQQLPGENMMIYTCNLTKGSPISPNLLNTSGVDSLDLYGPDCREDDIPDNKEAGKVESEKPDAFSDVEHVMDLPDDICADETLKCEEENLLEKPCVEEVLEESCVEQKVSEDMIEMHLYVQSHSDVLIALFMEEEERYEYNSLRTLWEMLLPHLGDVEAQLKTLPAHNKNSKNNKCNNNNIENNDIGDESKGNRESMKFVRFDSLMEQCETNIEDELIAPDSSGFVDSVNMFHHQLLSSSIRDLTFVGHGGGQGYIRRSGFEEVYLQQGGGYKSSQGPPHSSDPLWKMDQHASQKLKKISKSLSLI